MKKIILLLLFVFLPLLYAFDYTPPDERVYRDRHTYEVSIYEIEQLIIDYLKVKGVVLPKKFSSYYDPNCFNYNGFKDIPFNERCKYVIEFYEEYECTARKYKEKK